MKKWTMFHNNQDLLNSIRVMQLDWCKCWNFGSEGKPFGPWVSENVLAYARIFKLVYSYLNIIIQESSKVSKLASLMVQSWSAILSHIMQSEVDHESIQSLERHMKLFSDFTSL